jgi:2-polyprenyl-3-methyl-5-hydroxy-6-metoxy-1,4-benzoquinol methylase
VVDDGAPTLRSPRIFHARSVVPRASSSANLHDRSKHHHRSSCTVVAVTTYLLGHDAAELQRLEEQGHVLAPATGVILTLAGIAPGMRVLDLGTGVGDVALAVANRVGPNGSVLGIDRSTSALDVARERSERAKVGNVEFVEGDLTAATFEGQFDAVVSRLVLLYVEDPAAAIRRYASTIRSGGVFVAMEYEMTAAGSLPPTTLSSAAVGWIVEAFRRSELDPLLGPRLKAIFSAAGLAQPTTVGIQGYLEPDNSVGPRMAASIVRTLLPVIERTGIASPAEVDIDTLEQRIGADLAERGALFKPPTLVGTWARVAS